MNNYNYSKNKQCECGRLITNYSIKCRSCSKKGNLAPAYIDGKSLITTYCIDCGKKLNQHAYFYGTTRCRSCADKLHGELILGMNNPMYGIRRFGDTSPHWQGGKTPLKYTSQFNEQLKDRIRKRDNYTCQNPECNMTEEEHITVYGRALYVHHIDYCKENCNENNLMTLCSQCNTRANSNRIYWQELYTTKIKESLERE